MLLYLNILSWRINSVACSTPFASFRRVQASGLESHQDRQPSLLSKLSRELLPPPQSYLPPSDFPSSLLISNLLSAGVHFCFLDISSTQNWHTLWSFVSHFYCMMLSRYELLPCTIIFIPLVVRYESITWLYSVLLVSSAVDSPLGCSRFYGYCWQC